MAGMTPGLAAYKIAFELSPIIMNGGIFSDPGFPGNMMPIIALTEAVNFPFSILSSGGSISLDKFFAHYQVLPGSTLVKQQIANYGFANATVAANAVIAEPTQVSMLMICPIQNPLGWAEKLGIMSGLKWIFDKHNVLGGTYTILTPSYVYTNCVMRGMHDASSQLTKQVQNTYQLDFEKPLLFRSDLDQVLNSIGQAIQSASGAVDDVFGIGTATGTTVLPPSVMPATSFQMAAGTTGINSVSIPNSVFSQLGI